MIASRLAVTMPMLGAACWFIGANPVDWLFKLLRRLTGAGTARLLAKSQARRISTMSTKPTDPISGAWGSPPSEPNGDTQPKDISTFRASRLSATTRDQLQPALKGTFSPLSVVPAALDAVPAPPGELSSLRGQRSSVEVSNTHRERRNSRRRDLSSDRSEPVSSGAAAAGDAAAGDAAAAAAAGDAAAGDVALFWGCRLSTASTGCESDRVEAKSDRVEASPALKPAASLTPGRLRRLEVSAGHDFHEANAALDAHIRNGCGTVGSQSMDSVGSLTSPNRLRRPEVSAGHDVHEANAALNARSRNGSPTYPRCASISPLASLQAHSAPSTAALSSAPSTAAELERRRCLQRALHANPVFGTVSEEQLDELCPRMEVWNVCQGETVIQQGEKGDSFYVVLSGTFEVLLEQVRGGLDSWR